MKIELLDEEEFWMIVVNGRDILPPIHQCEESAIEEWEFWNRLNIEEDFLEEILTHEQIDYVVSNLKEKKVIEL